MKEGNSFKSTLCLTAVNYFLLFQSNKRGPLEFVQCHLTLLERNSGIPDWLWAWDRWRQLFFPWNNIWHSFHFKLKGDISSKLQDNSGLLTSDLFSQFWIISINLNHILKVIPASGKTKTLQQRAVIKYTNLICNNPPYILSIFGLT